MVAIPSANHTLMVVNGSQQRPVDDLSIDGLGFRDTAWTLMEPHGVPSGPGPGRGPTSPGPQLTLMLIRPGPQLTLMLISPGPYATFMLISPEPYATLMRTSPGPYATLMRISPGPYVIPVWQAETGA